MDGFKILRCLWKCSEKCFHRLLWNIQKLKIKLHKTPLNILKITLNVLDANMLYPEAKYNYDYFILNNV